MDRLPSGMKNLSLRGFGPFKVQLAGRLDYNTSLLLATLWDYPRSFIGSLKSTNADVGLMMVDKMAERGEIVPDDISMLTDALRQCQLGGIASEVESIFEENMSRNEKEKQEKQEPPCDRVNPSDQDTGAVEPAKATDSKDKQRPSIDKSKKTTGKEITGAVKPSKATDSEDKQRPRIEKLKKTAAKGTTEAMEPINLNLVTIEATDSKAKQQSIIDQLKEAADKGTPIHNLVLDTSFRSIDESGSITLHSGLILPLFSTLTALSVWTEEGRIMTETELTGFLQYGSKSTQLNALGFARCDLPSLSSSTEVLKEIQKKGVEVPWVDTAHCLDTSSGSWEMDNINTVRRNCEAGIVMHKPWRKETQELQIKMLQFASENDIPVRKLIMNESYRSASPDGTRITLQSGQTLPALSTVKIINITTEDGRKIPADEFAHLLKFANKSQIIEDLSFDGCELPPTLPASSISPEMKSRNFKVSWLGAGHCFDLNLRTWKIADLDTIRESCGLGVVIYQQFSSHMHKLQVHFLTVASQNNVPISFINLSESYRTVDATTGSIILESGVMLPRLTSLGRLSINAEGRELTEEDADGVVKYSNHSSQCSEVDFYWCFLPWSVPTDRFPAHLRSGKFLVLWDPEDREDYTLDLASGRWVNHATKMALTEKEYQDMLARFRLKYK